MTHKDKFETRHTDEFLIEVPYLGDIRRLTVCHDGWGLGAGWHLDRIKVKNVIDGKVYQFPCDRWLDSGSGDRQIMRDLVERSKGQQHLVPGKGLGKRRHLTRYKVTVITGTVKGAGTDANVNVVLYGEHGRSGRVDDVVARTQAASLLVGESAVVVDAERAAARERQPTKLHRSRPARRQYPD